MVPRCASRCRALALRGRFPRAVPGKQSRFRHSKRASDAFDGSSSVKIFNLIFVAAEIFPDFARRDV